MKKIFYLFYIITGIVALAAGEHKSAGPPGCFAGEPPNNRNCTHCHSDYAVNTGTANIIFDLGGADTGYTPGHTYDINVAVKKTGLQAGGFLLTVLRDNDATTTPGTFTLTDTIRTQKVDPSNPHVQGCALQNKVYVEHTYQGHTGTIAGENSWVFKWQAPASSAGNVTFYLAVVEADYNGDEFGDYVYTQKVTSPGPVNSIGTINIAEEVEVYPNPAVAELFLRAGSAHIEQITLMNMHGAIVKECSRIKPEVSKTIKLDISGVSSGVYFLVLQGNGQKHTRKVVVQ